MRVLISIMTLILVGCGSDSGGGGNGIVAGTFSDNAVTTFAQTGGLAKTNQEKLKELIIPSAYAASGSFSCISGDTAVFDATVFAINYVLQVTCASDMDTKIRASLLETMENKVMLIEVSEQGKAQTTFTMPTVSNNKMTFFLENVKALLPPAHPNYDASVADCYSQVVFDLTTGTITEGVSVATTGLAGQGGSQNASCGSGLNDYTSGFTATRHFRFKDGKIEMDFSDNPTFDPGTVDGNGVPSNIDVEVWCIDANTDQVCDPL